LVQVDQRSGDELAVLLLPAGAVFQAFNMGDDAINMGLCFPLDPCLVAFALGLFAIRGRPNVPEPGKARKEVFCS
jgi:hypothetical protein